MQPLKRLRGNSSNIKIPVCLQAGIIFCESCGKQGAVFLHLGVGNVAEDKL